MSRHAPTSLLLTLTGCIVALLSTGTAAAGVDVRFGVDVPIGDDGRLFVSIASRYFDRSPEVVANWNRQVRDPDDLAVGLFLARGCGKDPEFVFSLRRGGLGWFEISNRCAIPVDTYFLAQPARRPGPPYGRAYGHWKKHRENPRYVVRLSDAQMRALVMARMASEYYGVPLETAMDWRRNRGDARRMMVMEYRARHAHQDGADQRGPDKHGGKGKEHGRGHGHDKDGKHGGGHGDDDDDRD